MGSGAGYFFQMVPKAGQSELRLLDGKHRLSIPADFAKQLKWLQKMKLSVEALGDGRVKLSSPELAAVRAASIQEELAQTTDEEDLLAAISDRFREATFYVSDYRVTLPVEIHALFDLDLTPVNVLVELRADGILVMSHAQRLSRLHEIFG